MKKGLFGFIFGLLCLCIQSGFAQTAAPLIFEKTYLHTDRDVYSRGDTVWYKAYLVNAQDNKLISSSGNLRIELISPDAKIITSELIRLDKGLGNGDFDLPDSIPSGKYHLRAYTNWMRNFGDNFVFEKEITVLNTDAVTTSIAATIPAKGSKKATATTKKTASVTPLPIIALPFLSFYPESGSLIEGLTGMVAVKADNGLGHGIPATGIVISSGGDTVARFTCDTAGMGLFALVPLKGQSYHAVANFVNPSRRGQVFELPTALSSGLALQVRQTDSLLRAIVGTNADASALALKPLYRILVKHNGITIISQQIQVTGQQTAVRISTASLPEGVNAITLYDADNKPSCERLVYIHHPGKKPLAIATNKKTYQPKEQVSVQISAPANTSLSMTVVDAGLVPEQADDIVSYLMLQSELKGNIEHARRYFDTTNVNRFKQLDLLLMTQGWRNFVWRRMADTAIHISYPVETSIPVSGLVKDEIDEKPLSNLNVTLYADAAKGTKIFGDRTNLSGRFNIAGLMMTGTQNVKLASVNDKGDKKGTFAVDTIRPMPVKPVSLKIAPQKSPGDSLIEANVERKIAGIKNSKVNGITYLKEVKIKGQAPIVMRGGDILTTFGYPDQVFNIKPEDDQYKTLQWYLMQLGNGIQQPSELGRWHDIIPTGVEIMGRDTAGGSFNAPVGTKSRLIPPQIFVNGEELNMDEAGEAEAYRTLYFNMPLHKFKKIVLKHMIGTFHGITYHGNLAGQAADGRGFIDRYLLYLTMNDDYMTDNPGSLSINIPGYYQARTFYQPPPGAKTSLADFRTTIHWEPDITTDANGKATVKFYNAVPTGDVRVIIQGVTASGVPVTMQSGYVVK